MKQITDKVKVGIADVTGKVNDVFADVTYVELDGTAEDISTFIEKPENLALLVSAANYGFNLKARAKVTAQIKAENQGPEVSINRFVKQLVANSVKNGKPITEKAAREKVLANAEIFGIDLAA